MASQQAALDRLPAEILFLILGNVDTATDHASLSRTCRSLHSFMKTEGWRCFTRRCFPGVFSGDLRDQGQSNGSNGNESGSGSQIDALINNADSDSGEPGWAALAETLTWQSRAWDRQALAFRALAPKQDHIPRHKRPRPYMPSLAVHFQADLAESGKRMGLGIDGEELLVIGAGEDIVARYRKRGRQAKAEEEGGGPQTLVFDGQAAGFRPGFDDVRSVTVVENAMGTPRRRGILAGRDNGVVALLSGEPDGAFGTTMANFVPEEGSDVDQTRIYSIDLSTNPRNASSFGGGLDSGLAAVTTPSSVLFYPMPKTENPAGAIGSGGGGNAINEPMVIHPVADFDLGNVGLYNSSVRRPFNARWMEASGTVALAMGAGPKPLRYLTATPAGVTELTAAYNMPDLMEHYSLTEKTLVLPSSLTPVPMTSITGGNGYLTLTGWRDGTCRLQDLRSASPYDLIYEDNVLGSQDSAQAILIWGTERFITGNQGSAGLKVFDLRWPRRYFHTDALPCSGRMPWPAPPMPMGAPGSMDMAGQTMGNTPNAGRDPLSQPHFIPPELRTPQNWPPRASGMPLQLPQTICCDMARSIRCRWHTASRDLFYRSSSALFLQRSLESKSLNATGVFALASAASTDLAPSNFYASLNNCVVEAYLHEQVVAYESPRFHPPGSTISHRVRSAIWAEGGEAPYFGYPPIMSNTVTGQVTNTNNGNISSNGVADITNGLNGLNVISTNANGAGSGQAGKNKVKGKEKGGNVGSYKGVYHSFDVDVALMETGDSMARPNIEGQPMWLPRIRNRKHSFDTVPKEVFEGFTKEGMRGYSKRHESLDGGVHKKQVLRLDSYYRERHFGGNSAAEDQNGNAGGAGGNRSISKDDISFRDRCLHRLDFGFQDDADFK